MVRRRALCGLVLPAAWAVPAPVEAVQCTRVVFSANPDYPPYHWAEGGRIVGASVALTGRILDKLGVRWEARFVGPWPRVLKSAEHGEIDLVVSLKPTPERETYLEFTRSPSFTNPMAVFTARARPLKFDGPQDLVGRRGGRTAGDRFGDSFDRFAEQSLTLEDADSLDVNFGKLLAGRIDYVVTGLPASLAAGDTLHLTWTYPLPTALQAYTYIYNAPLPVLNKTNSGMSVIIIV